MADYIELEEIVVEDNRVPPTQKEQESEGNVTPPNVEETLDQKKDDAEVATKEKTIVPAKKAWGRAVKQIRQLSDAVAQVKKGAEKDSSEEGLQCVRIKPDQSGAFGFELEGGVEQDLPVTVKSVVENSPAAKSNPPLRRGDVVVYVNRKSVQGKNIEEIKEMLQSNKKGVELIIEPARLPPGLHRVQIKRNKQRKIGIVLEDAVSPKMPMTIDYVMANSPASRCVPRLQEGDFVLRVNWKSVRGKEVDDIRDDMLKASKKGKGIALVVKPVDELSDDDKVQFITGSASKYFDDTKYQDAVDAFGDALLKSNTHTEVYKALTKYGYSFPEEKANALAIQLASRNVKEGTTDRHYLNNCYLPLFGIATYPMFDLESLAEKMFLQLENVFPNRADFFSKSKNPLDEDSVVNPETLAEDIISLMEEDDIKGIIKLKPADLWGGEDVWTLALEHMTEEAFDRFIEENADDVSIHEVLLKVCVTDDDGSTAMKLLKALVEKYKRDGELGKKLITDLLRELMQLFLDIDNIQEYAEYLLAEGANPLEGSFFDPYAVTIVARKGPQFRSVAETLGKGGVDLLRKRDKYGWSVARDFLDELLSQRVHEDVICGILRHTVKDLPVKDEKICQESLQELRDTALDDNYYDVLLELLRVQFDLSTFCKMIDLVAQKEVKESVLIRFVEELDLDLSGKHHSIAKEKDKKFMGANVMHQAAAGGLTTFIKEILSRGDTAELLQAKREGEEALPFQTALQKGKYATAILLLKGIKDQDVLPLDVMRKELSKLLRYLGEQERSEHELEPQLFIEPEKDVPDFEDDLLDWTDYFDDMSESEGDDKVDNESEHDEIDEPEHEEMDEPMGEEVDELQSGGLEVEDEAESKGSDDPLVGVVHEPAAEEVIVTGLEGEAVGHGTGSPSEEDVEEGEDEKGENEEGEDEEGEDDEEEDDDEDDDEDDEDDDQGYYDSDMEDDIFRFRYYSSDDDSDEGYDEELVHRPDKKEEIQEIVSTILNTCVRGDTVDCKILDEEIEAFGEETCYSLISKYKLKEVQNHECYQALVEAKWAIYGRIIFMFYFLYYMMFLLVLTAALALAAESPDPSLYCDGIDWFRLFLEILTIIAVGLSTVTEVVEFWRIYKGKGGTIKCPPNKYLWRAVKSYISDWQNWMDVLAIISTALIIPFRIADSDWQWRFAALAFIFHGLRIFKYAVLWPWIGEYTEVLVQVVKKDITRFALVFAVVALSLGGGLYFALRGEVSSSANTNSTCSSEAYDTVSETSLGTYRDSTSEIYLTWLHTVRILAEGSILDYYDDYKWFSIFIYWLIIFSVVVILLNLLIAQFNTTYGELQKAHRSATLTRAGILYQLESNPFARPLIELLKSFASKDAIEKAKRTFVEYGGDSQEDQVQAIDSKVQTVDRKLVHVSTTLRKHGAALKEMKTKFAEAQQREEEILKILRQPGTAGKGASGPVSSQRPPASKDTALITMEDALQCCRHIEGDVALLAAALDIPDKSLQEIQSKYQQAQGQALQMIKTWMTSTGGDRVVLISILRGSEFGKAAEVLSCAGVEGSLPQPPGESEKDEVHTVP